MQLHHEDGNRKNNNENNLRLLCPNCHVFTDNYAGRNHARYCTGKYTDIFYNKKQEKDMCPVCNTNLKMHNAKMCKLCWNKKRSNNIPEKSELEKDILCKPFVEIGLKYGVSDNAVRKWCKKYGLPYKKQELKEYRLKTITN